MTTVVQPKDIEARREAERLFKAAVAAEKHYDDVRFGNQDPRVIAARAAFDAADQALSAAKEAARSEASIGSSRDAATAANNAYSDHPIELLTNDDGDIEYHPGTDIPLTADDELIEDADNAWNEQSQRFSREILGLPPRVKTQTDDELVEEAA